MDDYNRLRELRYGIQLFKPISLEVRGLHCLIHVRKFIFIIYLRVVPVVMITILSIHVYWCLMAHWKVETYYIIIYCIYNYTYYILYNGVNLHCFSISPTLSPNKLLQKKFAWEFKTLQFHLAPEWFACTWIFFFLIQVLIAVMGTSPAFVAISFG